MKTKILISVFILNLLGACDLPSLPDEIPDIPDSYFVEITLHIKGTVTDITDNSLVKAYVSLFKISEAIGSVHLDSVWTDDEGQYSIIFTHSELFEMKQNEGDFYLKVSATGYKTKKITYDEENHIRFTEKWQIIDIQLEPESGGQR